MYTWIELDAQALLESQRVLNDWTGVQTPCVPVLKANAYGHGLKEVYECLSREHPLPWIVVNELMEADQLRRLGYLGRIMVCGPAYAQEFERAVQLDADIFLGDRSLLSSWRKASAATAVPNIHLKIDTGLSRQGLRLDQLQDELDQIASAQLLRQVFGVCSHFANVEDVLEHDYARQQLAEFSQTQRLVRSFYREQACDTLPLFHIASSAAALVLPEARLDLCRAGISTYGLWPSKSTRLSCFAQHARPDQAQPVTLHPVLSWRAPVVHTQLIPEGRYIGYGCSDKTTAPTRIALIPVGYAEGLPRLIAEKPSYTLLHGRRCPIRGRISMNMTIIDITHLPDSLGQVGDTVTLIGQDGEEYLSAEQLADWAGTIHYELLTRLHPSMARRLVNLPPTHTCHLAQGAKGGQGVRTTQA